MRMQTVRDYRRTRMSITYNLERIKKRVSATLLLDIHTVLRANMNLITIASKL